MQVEGKCTVLSKENFDRLPAAEQRRDDIFICRFHYDPNKWGCASPSLARPRARAFAWIPERSRARTGVLHTANDGGALRSDRDQRMDEL